MTGSVPGPLRNAGWFCVTGKPGLVHRSGLRSEGLPDGGFHVRAGDGHRQRLVGARPFVTADAFGADRERTHWYVEHARQARAGTDVDVLERGSGHEQALQAN